MKTLALFCLILLMAVGAQAQVTAGITVTDDGVQSFYLAIGQNYHVPERDVVVIHERQIPDDEIPVVFFIADRAHVTPAAVVELRLAGQSWMDITLHYNLDPSIFYVALNGDPGPDYGRVYGYWKQPRNQWSKVRLADDDVVKMVNLQFVSAHYGVKTDEVVRLRGEQGSFVKVTHAVSSPEYKSHGAAAKTPKTAPSNGKGHDNGKGNGKGNGNGQKSDKQ